MLNFTNNSRTEQMYHSLLPPVHDLRHFEQVSKSSNKTGGDADEEFVCDTPVNGNHTPVSGNYTSVFSNYKQ